MISIERFTVSIYNRETGKTMHVVDVPQVQVNRIITAMSAMELRPALVFKVSPCS